MDSYWEAYKKFWKDVRESFVYTLRIPCTAESYELGAEVTILTYITTRYILKRPERALLYSSITFLGVPLLYWPYCKLQELKREQAKLRPYIEESSVAVKVEVRESNPQNEETPTTLQFEKV